MAPGASFTGSSASAYAGLLMLIALTASTTVLGHALDEDVAMDGAMQVDTGAATRSLLAAALPPAGARPVPTLSSVGGSYLNGVYFVPASDTQPRVLATFTEDVTPVSTVASTRYNGWLLITSNYRDNFVAATSRTFLFEVIGVPVDTQISVCMTAGKVKNAAGRTSDKSNCIDIVRASPPASPAPKDCPQSRAQEATGKVTPVGFSPPDAASKAFGPLKMACDKAGPFIVGKQTVKCQAVDPVGQGAACAPFDIEVKDTTPPHIKCPTEPVKKGAAADHFANGKKTFVDWDASADDVVDGEIELKCEGGNSGEGFGVGKHNIKCTAEDGAKNKVECDFDVEVEDETPPDIKCPTEPVKKGAAADHFKKNKTTLVDWEASAEDNVDGEIELKCEGGNSGEGFGVGKHSIKCTAEDEAKHVVECDFDVEVEDETPPDIKCPTEPVKKGAAADHFKKNKTTLVDWEASAEDNVDGEIELKCEGGNSGEGFGVGKHSIKCTAEDGAKHVVECDFDVEVEDETPPDIKCPTEPVKKGAAADHFKKNKTTLVDWEASAEDNVDGEIELKCEGGNSGEGFGVGKHSIKCTAEDEAKHVVECDFDVEVEDETPPDIKCPTEPVKKGAAADHFKKNKTTLVDWEASAEDNVDGEIELKCEGGNSGEGFGVGKHSIKCTAEDEAKHVVECDFDVEVEDETPPDIKCPTEPVKKGAAADHFANGKKTFVDWEASAEDNVDGEIELKCEGGNSGEGFGVGKHSIKCTAEDEANHVVECDFDVEVEDETPPDIKCPTEPVKKGAAADHFANGKKTFVDWEASAEDNVDGEIELKCEGGNSGEGFGVGKHSIKCTAEDGANHVVECDFDVEVEDETPPDIKCPTEPVKKGAAADHFANGKKTFVDWEASAEDNVDGEIELKCEGGNSGEGFGVGKHSIKCTAEDEANHVVECDFDVEVEDETPPDIKCPTEPVKKGAAADHFANGKKTFVDWEASAEDNVDGEIELKCEGGNSGEGFGVGKHSIKCTAEDEANHVVECDFDVEVEDETPPDITCPEMPIEEEASDQHGSDKHWTAATWEEASAEDNVDGKLPVVCDHKPGDKFDVDSTIVKCSVKDSAGKATECSFEVNIKDNKKPDLTCPKRIETALGVATVWGDNAAPTALDNVDGPLTGIKCVDEDKLPVDLPQEFTLGNHHITCSAADSHGNEGTCQILLVVSDKTAPNIHCPASVVQEASDDHKSNGHKTKAVLDTSADDSVDGTVSVDCGGNNEFDVGNTIVECSASDKSGNKATCQIKVTIQDKKKPTVSCPGNIEVTQGVGISLAATASDNVDDSLNVQCTDKDGKIVTSTSSLPLGTNGITCTATDSSGNEGRCSFNVKVAQATPVPATPVPATPVPATPVPATPEPETACRTDADCPAGKRCQGAVDKKKCVGSGSAAIAEATGGEASFSTATATDFRAAKSGVSIGLIVGVVAAVALLAAAVIGVIITRKRTHPKRLTVSTHQAAEEPNPAVTVSVRSGGTPRSRRGTPRSGAVMHPVARLGELRQERVRRFRPSDDGSKFCDHRCIT
eukprot:jgi/Mesvir1/17402/Mv25039-RA.11